MLAILATLAVTSCRPSAPAVSIHHDPPARTVFLRTGAVDLPAPDSTRAPAYHAHAAATPLTRVAWPVDGWARGFRLRITDCAGNEVSRSRLHHLVLVHLGRRDLIHPIYQRLMAITQESEDVVLPRSVGMRLAAGDSLGILVAWMPGLEGAERVQLELAVPYLAANTNPRPTDVVPIGFDVNFEPGGGASFDVPPGHTTFQRDFTMPLDGRVLVTGGHLHDYARSMTLVDLISGKAVMEAKPSLDPDGRILGVARRMFGASGEGVRLRAGRQYRLTVIYDNPTGSSRSQAGMGILAGLFSAGDAKAWPPLDPSSPRLIEDLQMLTRTGPISPHRH